LVTNLLHFKMLLGLALSGHDKLIDIHIQWACVFQSCARSFWTHWMRSERPSIHEYNNSIITVYS